MRLGRARRCPRAVWQAFHDATGVKIIDGIGSHRAAAHLHRRRRRPDQAGLDRACRCLATRRAVLGRDGQPVPDGEPGRLAVKGPTGCRYLADDRQRSYVSAAGTSPATPTSATPTATSGTRRARDDMIISAGYNIAGPEVEEALLAHPDVAECGVVGVARRGARPGGDGLRGAERRREPGRRLVAELQDFVKAEIAPYKYPRAIEFVAALPRTRHRQAAALQAPRTRARIVTPRVSVSRWRYLSLTPPATRSVRS